MIDQTFPADEQSSSLRKVFFVSDFVALALSLRSQYSEIQLLARGGAPRQKAKSLHSSRSHTVVT